MTGAWMHQTVHEKVMALTWGGDLGLHSHEKPIQRGRGSKPVLFQGFQEAEGSVPSVQRGWVIKESMYNGVFLTTSSTNWMLAVATVSCAEIPSEEPPHCASDLRG